MDRIQSEATNCIDQTFSDLARIWDSIGLQTTEKISRCQVFCDRLFQLCENILQDEDEAKRRVVDSLKHNRDEIVTISQELQVAVPAEVENGTLLEKCQAEEEVLLALKQLRSSRVNERDRLITLQKKLCEMLDEQPYGSDLPEVPSEEELLALQEHVDGLTKEKGIRKHEFNKLKRKILEMLVTLEEGTEEQMVASLEESEDEEEDLCLTETHLKSLKNKLSDLEFRQNECLVRWEELREQICAVWEILDIDEHLREAVLETTAKHTPSNIAKLEEELGRMKILKLKQMSIIVGRLKEQLEVIWEDVWLSDEERASIPGYYDDPPTEVSLQLLEEQLRHWKKHRTAHEELYLLAGNFERLFDEVLKLEQKLKDPKRLFNTRGGALLQEERERKKIKAELPRVQDRLVDLYNNYESTHGCPAPLLYGRTVVDYIDEKWACLDVAREQEKNSRLKGKGAPVKPALRTAVSKLALKAAVPTTPSRGGAAATRGDAAMKPPGALPASGSTHATPCKRGAQDTSKEGQEISKRPRLGHAGPLPTGNRSHESVSNRQTTGLPQPKSYSATQSRSASETRPISPCGLQDLTTLDYNKFERQLRSSNDKLNSTTTMEAFGGLHRGIPSWRGKENDNKLIIESKQLTPSIRVTQPASDADC